MNLPKYEDCAKKSVNGEKLNPLEYFILYQEPKGYQPVMAFRAQLAKAIEFIIRDLK